MAFQSKDRFFHKAKADGYLARSAYKLEELQKKFGLMRPGDLVLDMGASPGAWSQVAVKEVGPSGRVIGLDLKPVEFRARNAQFHVMDAFEFDPAILKLQHVNCLLSDMAPNTTGHRDVDQARSFHLCLKVVEVAERWLAPGGHCVMKMFEGPDTENLASRLQALFANVKRLKPEAVRKGSFETYFVGLRKLVS